MYQKKAKVPKLSYRVQEAARKLGLEHIRLCAR
jgi:hypothetical protein